ncbi:PKD domain-containing protein [Taibaiella koreensis]|uniref:PKD domain-containing protein n=1 Tax=Taibaiella koreensis TaxID=1268548 RepID=UPI000E59C7E2|nr:PKD domain-containing protein [Taibaiella koreensis]
MLWNKNTSKIVGITLLVAALVVLAIFGIRSLLPTKGNLKSGVYPRVVDVSDSIYYSDSSDFGRQYRWVFGDGTQSFTPAGRHKYNAPGNYTVVLTVNNKFTDTFFVSVTGTAPTFSLTDSLITIDAKELAMQGENIVFRAKGQGATEFVWDFGDGSSPVSTTSDMVQYAYPSDGEFVVRLKTRSTEYPVTHKITIVPSYKAERDSLANLDAIYQQYENDFKYHLQQIADGGDFDQHYYYLLRRYLCGNEKAVMKINDQKINDFNTYCLNLQFAKNILIQSVKLVPDNDIHCIKMAEVKTDKKL